MWRLLRWRFFGRNGLLTALDGETLSSPGGRLQLALACWLASAACAVVAVACAVVTIVR